MVNWKNLELLHNRGDHPYEKIFSGNDPSMRKNMRRIRIWYFRIKKRFPDSGKACVLERKAAKIANPPSYCVIAPQLLLSPKLKMNCTIPSIDVHHFCDFSLQYTGPPWIREAFFRFENVKFGFPTCFYSLEGSFPEKNFLLGWPPTPYCVVAPKISCFT